MHTSPLPRAGGSETKKSHPLRTVLQFLISPRRIIVSNQSWGNGQMISGQLVLVTLYNPREKFWGIMLALEPAGVSIRGVDLQSLDDFTQLVKSGEAASASVVFFPMHRVQKIEEDRNT
jgi:hypothetical protein